MKFINFRIPSVVHQALKDSIEAEGKKVSVSNYYLQLVGFEFYKTYLEYFTAVVAGEVAKEETLQLDDLPKSPISKHQFHQVVKNGYKGSLTSRTCPEIFLSVVTHIDKKLNYGGDIPVLFRELTLPIAIHKLAPYLGN